MLARHDARRAEDHEAELHAAAMGCDALDFGKRKFGGEPCTRGTALGQRPHARHVVDGDAAAEFDGCAALGAESEF